MIDLTKDDGSCFVAKLIKYKVPQEHYFADVQMQAMCQHFAKEYNSRGVPKKVNFLDAFAVECFQRHGNPMLACETLMKGNYTKFNNNYGYVSKDDRNTPQAFSHFTYVCSGQKFLVVDIQGVGDMYTDPQIHSSDGLGFGLGNKGHRGIKKFFETHKCNDICVGLGLSTRDQQQNFDGTFYKGSAPKPSAITARYAKPLPRPADIDDLVVHVPHLGVSRMPVALS